MLDRKKGDSIIRSTTLHEKWRIFVDQFTIEDNMSQSENCGNKPLIRPIYGNLDGLVYAATNRRNPKRRRPRVTIGRFTPRARKKRRPTRDGLTALQDSGYIRQLTSLKRIAGPSPNPSSEEAGLKVGRTFLSTCLARRLA